MAFNGFKSAEYVATSGVPQGSVLGPLFFIIFINDIVDGLDNVNYLMYADDLKLFSKINSIDDCIRLQKNLDKVSDWCIKYKLPLNSQKCNVMSYTRKLNTISYDYTINDTILHRPETLRDLGVVFDKTLSFNVHINTIVTESSKMYGLIVRYSRDFSNLNTLKILYYCYIRSKLEYASLVWTPHYNVHINSLESVQRKFLKLLHFKSEGFYPAIGFPQEELLRKYSIVGLSRRRECFSQIFLLKLINNSIDVPQLLSKISFNIPRTSRNGNVFYMATPRTNILKCSPIYVVCDNYNAICTDIDIFNCSITALKTYYYRRV